MSSILIKKVDVYSPEPKGVMDILIINEQIVALDSKINLPRWLSETKVIKGDNLKAVPGFIDAHVHITGGIAVGASWCGTSRRKETGTVLPKAVREAAWER